MSIAITGSKKINRIKHIFQFMEYDYLDDWQENFVQSVEKQFGRKKFLSERQLEVLEDIFKKAADKATDGEVK